MATFLPFGIMFLDCLLGPVHLLAQLCERVLCGIVFCLSWQHGSWIFLFRLARTYNNPWYCVWCACHKNSSVGPNVGGDITSWLSGCCNVGSLGETALLDLSFEKAEFTLDAPVLGIIGYGTKPFLQNIDAAWQEEKEKRAAVLHWGNDVASLPPQNTLRPDSIVWPLTHV